MLLWIPLLPLILVMRSFLRNQAGGNKCATVGAGAGGRSSRALLLTLLDGTHRTWRDGRAGLFSSTGRLRGHSCHVGALVVPLSAPYPLCVQEAAS